MKIAMRLIRRIPMFLLAAILLACGTKPENQSSGRIELPRAAGDTLHSGIVTETMLAGDYQFICINAGKQSFWLAARPIDISIGDELSYRNPLLMKDFHSAALDRTFPAILFVNQIDVTRRVGKPVPKNPDLPSGHPLIPGGSAPALGVEDPIAGTFPARPGQHTIEQLFASKEALSGQRVRVAGKVVKINANIMGKNWIHLRDGTGQEGTNDLVLTSTQSVDLGSNILAEGLLVVGKTLEKGYYFPLLLEEASLTPTR